MPFQNLSRILSKTAQFCSKLSQYKFSNEAGSENQEKADDAIGKEQDSAALVAEITQSFNPEALPTTLAKRLETIKEKKKRDAEERAWRVKLKKQI